MQDAGIQDARIRAMEEELGELRTRVQAMQHTMDHLLDGDGVLHARALVIKDDDDVVRARLGMEDNEVDERSPLFGKSIGVGLHMRDADGTQGIAICVYDAFPQRSIPTSASLQIGGHLSISATEDYTRVSCFTPVDGSSASCFECVATLEAKHRKKTRGRARAVLFDGLLGRCWYFPRRPWWKQVYSWLRGKRYDEGPED